MNINQLLQGIDCSCGKKHTCGIEAVYIEKGAILRLKDLCKNDQKILLIADENTFGAAGRQTEEALEGKSLERVIFSSEKILVPNEQAVEAVCAKLEGIDLMIAIGSGVLQDLCKYVSFQKKVPYMVVATAPSMDGYASDGAAMILGGMKVTVKSGLPRALVADPAILANAPLEMIQAGYGDIIGKFSALNDWKLSQCVNGEYFCDFLYDLTFEQIQTTLKLAKGLLAREEESIKALMEALMIVGILMSFAGSSRPASGSEHHLSHYFEIVGILTGEDYFPHGLDVAYSTVVTAQLREDLLAREFPAKIYRPTAAEYRAAMEAIYREVAQGCMDLQEKVGEYAKDRAELYLSKEQEIRAILAQMPTAAEIREMLALAELDMQDFYALYNEEKIKNSILYAKDLKDRYTVLWLNYDYYEI